MSFNFELISLEKSFEKRPEHSVDQEVLLFKQHIKDRKVNWTKEEKLELETDKFDTDETLSNTQVHFSELKYNIIAKSLNSYVKKGYRIIGFDESSNTMTGTYALLASFKFGECQLTFNDGKYQKEKIMYPPITAYIEDNDHKLIIYRDVIKNFIEVLKMNFGQGPLKNNLIELEKWFKEKYRKKIDSHIDGHDFYYPSMGHVVDRIRTADEILKSIIRIIEVSDWGKEKDIIFLGDGIQMFRQHIFPPVAFIKFFYQLLKTYDIKYFSFSKTCRLRDAQGNFILPIWSNMLEGKQFLVELPDLSKYTKSKACIVRIQEQAAALRFDVPDYYSLPETLNILQNLKPYSPFGYPLCLEEAHNASTLLVSEYNKLEGNFIDLQLNQNTQMYIQKWRNKILIPTKKRGGLNG